MLHIMNGLLNCEQSIFCPRISRCHDFLPRHPYSETDPLWRNCVVMGGVMLMWARKRTYAWRGWDEPDLVNTATVAFHRNHLDATGVQECPHYAARWELITGPHWITREINVEVAGNRWGRTLRLVRRRNGQWRDKATASGTQPPSLASPGIAPGTDLSTTLDCDLDQCPLTCTMPIRRLGLLEGAVPSTNLIVARVELPSLRVTASEQHYASIDAHCVTHGVGAGADVVGVDARAVVTDYPRVARRVGN